MQNRLLLSIFRPVSTAGRPLQGTLPVLITWNIFTALPMFTDVVALMEYLAETLAITVSGRLCALVD